MVYYHLGINAKGVNDIRTSIAEADSPLRKVRVL